MAAAYIVPLRIAFGIVAFCAFALVAVAIPIRLPGENLQEETEELLDMSDLEDKD